MNSRRNVAACMGSSTWRNSGTMEETHVGWLIKRNLMSSANEQRVSQVTLLVYDTC